MILTSEKQAHNFVIEVIDHWTDKKMDEKFGSSCEILGQCFDNAIALHVIMKQSGIKNKTYVKYGTFRLKDDDNSESFTMPDGRIVFPFHFWNVIEINGKNLILDVTYVFLHHYYRKNPEILLEQFKKRCTALECYDTEYSVTNLATAMKPRLYIERENGYIFTEENKIEVNVKSDEEIVKKIVKRLRIVAERFNKK